MSLFEQLYKYCIISHDHLVYQNFWKIVIYMGRDR